MKKTIIGMFLATIPVWWRHPLPWYLVTGLYYILTWVLVGPILSAFIRPRH